MSLFLHDLYLSGFLKRLLSCWRARNVCPVGALTICPVRRQGQQALYPSSSFTHTRTHSLSSFLSLLMKTRVSSLHRLYSQASHPL